MPRRRRSRFSTIRLNGDLQAYKKEIRDYIRSCWVYEDFKPDDLIEKLLEDKFQRHITEINSTDLISNDNKEFSVPTQYLELLEYEIFHAKDPFRSNLFRTVGKV
ncbi:hypothetical protein G9A89_003648 [Geosiphon pyriformis]|nr:hypothetical protein G9A89_003648 [Geosiphon pyriformis]